MIKEDRYLVLKWRDIYKYLSEEERYTISKIASKIAIKRQRDGKEADPEFVCVRSTWPEYEEVWKMIEKRVDGESTIHG